MFLYKGKEYYPLDFEEIITKGGEVIYDRNKRKKSYVYIVLEGTENKEE